MRRLSAVVVFVLLGLAGGLLIGRELYKPYRGYSNSQLLVIGAGTRAPAVADLLTEHGILAHRLPFLIWYWIGRRHRHLKAGEYLFDRPLGPHDVYRKLVHGDVYLHTVIIPEGSDQFDIARMLSQEVGVRPEEFLRVVREPGTIRDLDPHAPTLEGYLFPDTYRFPRGVSPETAAISMLTRFRRVLDNKLAVELGQNPGSLHDIITLASLVEKETPEPRERPIIAGVFARRLRKGWPLECDPTVVYAARLDHRFLDRPAPPITQGDLQFHSAYNTYRHLGLPPGPICNPGEASIQAAINPVGNEFLYFVSNNHGGHLFARTLAEHQRNVARYRREVAEVHRAALEQTTSSQPSSQHRGEAPATKSSTKSAKHKEQKATHPRVPSRTRSRTGGVVGDSGHTG
jgi:UPF0755 protein